MTLTLYKFGEQWGISDPSPFCVKLENFLRINDIPYSLGDLDIKTALNKAPKKKLPFVQFENSTEMGDSSLIIEKLCADNNIDMDKGLTKEQRAQSHAFRRMLDESLYFVGLYARWVEDTGWEVIKPLFFDDAPQLLRGLISGSLRKNVIKKCYKQGIAYHSQEEIYNKGFDDVKALSDLLGEDTWFFGAEKPTLLDIWSHAFIIQFTHVPIENALKERLLTLNNVSDHAKRLQELLYSNKKQS